ncbi:hypothetical protein Hanom_Chr07g00587441 [Helianthus anomalus]
MKHQRLNKKNFDTCGYGILLKFSFRWPPEKLGVNVPARKKNPVLTISTRARKRAGGPNGMAKNYGRKAEKHRK